MCGRPLVIEYVRSSGQQKLMADPQTLIFRCSFPFIIIREIILFLYLAMHLDSNLKAIRDPIRKHSHSSHIPFHLPSIADPYPAVLSTLSDKYCDSCHRKRKWHATDPHFRFSLDFPAPVSCTTVPRFAQGFTLTHLYNWKLIVASCLFMHSPATNSLFFWLAFSWYPFRIFGGHDGMMGVGGNHGHSRRVDTRSGKQYQLPGA